MSSIRKFLFIKLCILNKANTIQYCHVKPANKQFLLLGFSRFEGKRKRNPLFTDLCSRSNIHRFDLEFQSLSLLQKFDLFSWCFICIHTILNNNRFQIKTHDSQNVNTVAAQISTYLLIRCLMVSTNQADPGCFYFRIS